MYIDLTYKNSDLTLITLLSLTVICIFCANRDVSNKKKSLRIPKKIYDCCKKYYRFFFFATVVMNSDQGIPSVPFMREEYM
jgi:hypothetical protein